MERPSQRTSSREDRARTAKATANGWAFIVADRELQRTRRFGQKFDTQTCRLIEAIVCLFVILITVLIWIARTHVLSGTRPR